MESVFIVVDCQHDRLGFDVYSKHGFEHVTCSEPKDIVGRLFGKFPHMNIFLDRSTGVSRHVQIKRDILNRFDKSSVTWIPTMKEFKRRLDERKWISNL